MKSDPVCPQARFALRVRCAWLVVLSLSSAAWGAPPPVLVDNFDDDIQNHLAGYRNSFDRAPSTARAERVDTVFRGEAGRSIQIEGHRQADGYCGFWLHFFDMRAVQKKFFDARPYGYLSFWIRGERGGEEVLVKLADKHWIEKEDAVAVGRVSDFLRRGISTEWQEVLVPMGRQSQLDWSQMGGLVFEFDKPSDVIVYVDDVRFQGEPVPTPAPAVTPLVPTSVVAPSIAPAVLSPRPAASRSPPGQPSNRQSSGPPSIPTTGSRKLWVWNTHDLLRRESDAQELLEFCRQQRIGEIWLQVLYALETERDSSHSELGRPGTVRRIELRQTDDLRRFLRSAHAQSLAVHALDGYPEFAQREFHKVPLGLVDTLIAFNAAVPAAERFDGIHFDNEPYLLLGWQDPGRREEILRDFLELNAECQRRIREQSTMRFGVDIPFWWQERDEATGRIAGEVEFRGKRQAASFHCIDLLDNVGIMNYRDTADGADGMIAHGRDLLAYADRTNGATVCMGVETFQCGSVPVWFCVGVPKAQFLAMLKGPAQDLARLSRLNEFRFRTLDDGTTVHLGVELGTRTPERTLQLATETLLEIARRFNLPEMKSPQIAASRVAAIALATGTNPEWKNFRPSPIVDSKSERAFMGFMADNPMLSKITFADDPLSHFKKELEVAEAFFRRYRHYGGTAIHYYETFREKTREGQ